MKPQLFVPICNAKRSYTDTFCTYSLRVGSGSRWYSCDFLFVFVRLFFVSVGTIFVHFGPFWKIWHSAWTLKMSAYSYILFCVPLFPSDLSALFKKTDSTLVVFDLPLQFFLFLFKMLCSHVRVSMRHFRLHSGARVFPFLSFVFYMFLFLHLSSFSTHSLVFLVSFLSLLAFCCHG